MIEIVNRYGVTTISQEYFANLIGYTVNSCYGVVGMADSDVTQSIKGLLHRSRLTDKGVKVKIFNDKLEVDLHIIVIYGINIESIVQSVINKVKYSVKENTGFEVSSVDIYVDGMSN